MLLGGDGGIRTHDGLLAHTPLAGEHLRPLGHVSKPTNYDSNPKALCKARTASSMYLSAMTTEILISLVLII